MCKNLGDRIPTLRHAKGPAWTQEFLAEKLVVDPDTVGGWERNEHKPTRSNKEKLANLFGWTVEELEDFGFCKICNHQPRKDVEAPESASEEKSSYKDADLKEKEDQPSLLSSSEIQIESSYKDAEAPESASEEKSSYKDADLKEKKVPVASETRGRSFHLYKKLPLWVVTLVATLIVVAVPFIIIMATQPDQPRFEFDSSEIGPDLSGKHSLPSGSKVWIMLVDREGKLYLQYPRVHLNSDGSWRASNMCGGDVDIARVMAVKVDQGADHEFSKRADAKEWGFRELPEGAKVLNTKELYLRSECGNGETKQPLPRSPGFFHFPPVNFEPTRDCLKLVGKHSLPLKDKVWILLINSDEKYFLQFPPVRLNPDGSWRASKVCPGNEELERIVAFRVTEEGDEVFRMKAEKREWGGFRCLPKGTEELDSIELGPVPTLVSPATK